MRLCQKISCNLPAISRGKYCEIHRTNKRKSSIQYQENIFDIEREQENKIQLQKKVEIENDRQLRFEQEEEYKRSMEMDIKRNEEIEYEKILELSMQEYYNEKKNKVKKQIEEIYYSIKIKLPDGDILVKNFGVNCSIGLIRDAIEIYFYEMKIKVYNYQIVFNYPKRIFTKEDNDILLSSLDVPKNFIIYVYNLDS